MYSSPPSRRSKMPPRADGALKIGGAPGVERGEAGSASRSTTAMSLFVRSRILGDGLVEAKPHDQRAQTLAVQA